MRRHERASAEYLAGRNALRLVGLEAERVVDSVCARDCALAGFRRTQRTSRRIAGSRGAVGGEEKSKRTLVHLLSVESAIIDQIFACSSIFNFNALSAGLRAEARGRCWMTSSISTRPPWPVARCALYGLLPVGSRSRSPCRPSLAVRRAAGEVGVAT